MEGYWYNEAWILASLHWEVKPRSNVFVENACTQELLEVPGYYVPRIVRRKAR